MNGSRIMPAARLWCRCGHAYSCHGLYEERPGCGLCRCVSFARCRVLVQLLAAVMMREL